MILSALKTPRRQIPEIDPALLWSGILLLALGLVMVYSASIAVAEGDPDFGNQPAYFLLRHAIYLGIGLIAGGLAFQVKLERWQKAAPWLFLLGVTLLVIVLLPGVSRTINGAHRWISLRFINLQPSELVKFFAVLYVADYTVRKMTVMQDLKQVLLPMAAVMALVGALLLREPDFGAFVVILAIAMGILFLGGLSARLFAILTLAVAIILPIMILVSDYRSSRLVFLNPWADPYGKGYQLSHALIAFGRGEWFGVGLGASVEKLFYLPEAHTDFLLAIIAEELGFAGVIVVVALFAILVQRAFAVGRQCVPLDRPYPALIAMGIGIWFGVQGFISMGVNMGILPTKGLTLPFMSYGGSSLLATCLAFAVLLRVDWENRQLLRGDAP
ncbi:MAG: putative lipid II flippase FtsW [Zoogloeaceae bacterium]|jgi:cell division protein FtsW|nr:putative lipid II flippase FtsW [Zoogloeaceae bacterium]